MNMIKTSWNYATLGESVIRCVVDTYVICRQQTHQFAKELPKKKVKAYKNLMTQTEEKIGSSCFRCFLPHARLTGEEFFSKMQAMAEKDKEFLGPDLLEEPISRESWTHLTLSERAQKEQTLLYESHLLVEESCDCSLFANKPEVLDIMETVLSYRLCFLKPKEQQVLTLCYGLDGEPCMSLWEIADLWKEDMLEVMRIHRDALLNLFFWESEKSRDKAGTAGNTAGSFGAECAGNRAVQFDEKIIMADAALLDYKSRVFFGLLSEEEQEDLKAMQLFFSTKEERKLLYSMKREPLGKILGTVNCRTDGTVAVADILFQMLQGDPMIREDDIAELYLCPCPEKISRLISPLKDEFAEGQVDYSAVQMKETTGFRGWMKDFRQQGTAHLSAEFLQKYLAVDVNVESQYLTEIEFLIFSRTEGGKTEYFMTLYDRKMKEEQEQLREISK